MHNSATKIQQKLHICKFFWLFGQKLSKIRQKWFNSFTKGTKETKFSLDPKQPQKTPKKQKKSLEQSSHVPECMTMVARGALNVSFI